MIEKLKELIKGVMPEVQTEGVTEETKLIDDLHFDSLGIMMLAMAIEDEFGLQFTEAINFVTVGDVIKYIEDNK
ncbi:MAG: phosphopantetheine-binding protein [Bacilli bacterium]|nr:phosphopantetheine-binding protein [Bacilli bacterium]